jgi:hypothetical protein
MMSLESIQFPSLNHTNYAEWVLRMEAILIQGDLWELVIEDEVLAQNEVDE